MAKFENLDALLKEFVKHGPPGCGCALAKNGKTIYEGYFGQADIDSGNPVTQDTVYRLYSMTKVIICTAALKLFEQGKYLLNEPLYEYFPEYREMTKFVTDGNGNKHIERVESPMLVKHAFSMAVGLPYSMGESDTAKAMAKVGKKLQEGGKFNLRTEIEAMSEVPIAFEPGTRWLYGYGHELVAGLIEVVSGKTVGQFLQDEIFDPLEMKSTGYRYHDDIEQRMISFYNVSENGQYKKVPGGRDEYHKPDAIYEGGGAGLYSTVNDYLRFTQMLANGGEYAGSRIIGRKTIDLMRRNQLSETQLKDFTNSYLAGYGYGLGVRTMMDPAAGHSNGSVGDFGWTGALGTWTTIDPSEGFSAVYMHQMMPNREEYHHLRVRAAAYGCL